MIVSTSNFTSHISHRLLFAFALAFVSLPALAQTRDQCLACHSDESLSTERQGKQVSLHVKDDVLRGSAHAKLACIACHTGFDPENVPHKEKITPVNCFTCHRNAPPKHPFHPQMASITGREDSDDVNCKSCHGTHNVKRPSDPTSPVNGAAMVELCSTCHGDVKEALMLSAHGKALAANAAGAPTCAQCHKSNIVLGSRDSSATKLSQEKLCLSCHLDNPDVRARMSPSAGFIAAYGTSVHGTALQNGNGKAANCVDCHGSHEMMRGSESGSTVSKAHIPETCAQCHPSEAHEYGESIHAVAAKRGVKDAPVCTDCHGEHNILAPSNPSSRVAPGNISAQVCSPCHSSVKLSEKYGISNDRFQTFSDSYHGLAVKAGSIEVANCASCHGAHEIRSSRDSLSSVSKSNLAATCGKCHPGANDRFGMGSVHITMNAQQEPILYWVSTGYVILIFVTIGGMFLHNLIDFVRKSRRKLMIRRGLIVEERLAHRLYVRMTLSERLQHATLVVSFITLVMTGFALKFPDAWWVAWVRDFSPLIFDIRGIAHRVAAVVMVAASIYHVYYLIAIPRGRELFRDLLPVRKDLTDAVGVLRYNLGFAPEKPQFGRFSYIEKSEYWALVWGTIVMGITGVILWFDNTFMGLLTKLGWDVARSIHYYEAWLATLAIIVWHFYFVIFNPDIYPINLAFWKGTLTEEEMAEEHPLELEEIHRREVVEDLDTPDDQPGSDKKKG